MTRCWRGGAICRWAKRGDEGTPTDAGTVRGSDVARLSLLVLVALGLDAALALADLGSTLEEYSVLQALQRASLEQTLDLGARMESIAERIVFLRRLRLGALLLTAVVFLTWWQKIHALAKTKIEIRRSMGTLLEWFVPIANLFLPYRRARVLNDHWTTVVWWAAWLCAALFEQLAWRAETGIDYAAMLDADRLHAASAGAALVAAAGCAAVVKRSTDRFTS